jgi:two-component system, NarL family, nitrate/nitrite response regulator NarL
VTAEPTPDGRTVLIVDDHALLGTTLTIALRAYQVVAHHATEPFTPDGIRKTAAPLEPGLALVDVDLGAGAAGRTRSGVDLVPEFIDLGWRVLMFTGSCREVDVAAAVAAGAVGWLRKTTPFDELLRAVLAATDGEPVMAEQDRQRLIQLHYAELARRRSRRAGLDQLTAREREVLADLVAGKRAAAIAEESVVSLATVRAQIRSILAKLGVSSQLEAVALLHDIERS